MTHRSNVLVRIPRPTTNTYQAAIAQIIRNIQGDMTDGELAERLGCAVGTIRNARDRKGCLNGVTLANIEREFGPSALDPFLALGGSRSVPLADQMPVGLNPTLELAEALHRVIETQRPDSDGGTDTTPNELRAILPQLRDGRLALDALIALAEAAPLRAVT